MMESTVIIAIVSAASGVMLALSQGLFKNSERRMDENTQMRKELRESNIQKDQEIAQLRKDYDGLKGQYYELRDQYVAQTAQLKYLQSEHDELKADYQALKASFDQLRKDTNG